MEVATLEQKLSLTEAMLEQERGYCQKMGETIAITNRELQDEQLYSKSLKAEMASAQKEIDFLRHHNNELLSQLESLRTDLPSRMEYYEHEITEHAKARRDLCEERDRRTAEAYQLQTELSRAQMEMGALKEQNIHLRDDLARSSRSGKTHLELEQQVLQLQGEVQWHQAAREKLEKNSVETRENSANQEQYVADLEKTL